MLPTFPVFKNWKRNFDCPSSTKCHYDPYVHIPKKMKLLSRLKIYPLYGSTRFIYIVYPQSEKGNDPAGVHAVNVKVVVLVKVVRVEVDVVV